MPKTATKAKEMVQPLLQENSGHTPYTNHSNIYLESNIR